jgi:hypothetical protein
MPRCRIICLGHLYPKRGAFSTTRIGPGSLDWDLVTCVNEIRRYLYGQVTDRHLSNCLANTETPLKMTRSLLSYYPLVTNPTVFKQLDGWLVDVLRRALQQRKALIEHFVQDYRVYSKQEIISGSWYVNDIPNETRLPSFYRGWLYVRKLLRIFDAEEFPAPDYES